MAKPFSQWASLASAPTPPLVRLWARRVRAGTLLREATQLSELTDAIQAKLCLQQRQRSGTDTRARNTENRDP